MDDFFKLLGLFIIGILLLVLIVLFSITSLLKEWLFLLLSVASLFKKLFYIIEEDE